MWSLMIFRAMWSQPAIHVASLDKEYPFNLSDNNMLYRIYCGIRKYWYRYLLKRLRFKYFGKNIKVRGNFRWGHVYNLEIQDNVVIGENSFINARGGVVIKSGTITGPDIMIFAENHIYDTEKCLPFDEGFIFKSVVIGENYWIGGKVFILPGVELGEGCVVAGGSVVTKSFPPLSVIGGNPAKLIKYRNVEKYNAAKMKRKYVSDISEK